MSGSWPESEWLDAALRVVVDVARERGRAESETELAVAVLRYLLSHPDAGAGEIARKLRRRRADVLRHVKRLRGAGLVGTSREGTASLGTAFPAATAVCPACGAELAVEVRAR
jgi:DNA-binding transcriptional ArsR family regulator